MWVEKYHILPYTSTWYYDYAYTRACFYILISTSLVTISNLHLENPSPFALLYLLVVLIYCKSSSMQFALLSPSLLNTISVDLPPIVSYMLLFSKDLFYCIHFLSFPYVHKKKLAHTTLKHKLIKMRTHTHTHTQIKLKTYKLEIINKRSQEIKIKYLQKKSYIMYTLLCMNIVSSLV